MIKIHLYASDSIRAYINSKKWQSIDQPNSLKTLNSANAVQKFFLPEFGDVIIKKTSAPTKHGLIKRLERKLRILLFRPVVRDAKCALLAQKLGISTYSPIAVWDTYKLTDVNSYIIYTFVEGTPLIELYDKTKSNDALKPEFLNKLTELGKISRKLHDGGITHRDLAPRNVLIQPNGDLAIIDFASGYKHSKGKNAITEASLLSSLERLLRLLDEEEIKSFNDGYCQNDSIEKKSQTLKKLLFWKVHGLKGKGGIHLLSHWIYLIKTTFIR